MAEQANYITDKVVISLLLDGIIKVVVKDEVEFTEKDLDDNYEIYLKIKKEDKAAFLVIFGRNSIAQPAARSKFADKKRALIKSKEALVLTSLAHRLMAQFHITFYKPAHPTKIFSTEDEALIWLRATDV